MSVMNSSTAVYGGVHNITGLQEFFGVLDQLPVIIQRNVISGALRAGANVLAEEARLRVPVASGQLKASIRVSVRLSNGRVTAFVKAGSRFKVYKIGKKGRSTKSPYKTVRDSGQVDYHAAFYAQMVEFGTVKMRAHPFMRPAFDGKKDAAIEAVAEYIRNRLPGEIAKLRR